MSSKHKASTEKKEKPVLSAMPNEYLESNIDRLKEDVPSIDEYLESWPKAKQIKNELNGIVGEDNISVEKENRARHGKDLTYHKQEAPQFVVYPSSIVEIQHIVKICRRYRFPIVPFGKGSSLEGNISASEGGISLEFTRMNAITEINVADRDCRVQCGVTRNQLNNELYQHNLFFPIDPGANATMGGMAATNASGPSAMFYGSMKDHVLGLTAVTSDGKVIKTGSRARKSSSGYNLSELLVGSEGTLAIVVELTLRLHVIPDQILSGYLQFKQLSDAVRTVIKAIQDSVQIVRCELLDELSLKAVNKFNNSNFNQVPSLFVEFHGGENTVKENRDKFENIAKTFKVTKTQWELGEDAKKKLWTARYSAWYALPALRPEAFAFASDVCVPISHLEECIMKTRLDAEERGMEVPIIGHVGDGNFHAFILVDMNDEKEKERVRRLNSQLVHRALEMDGTCTGEHGIGKGKKEFLKEEVGENAVEIMRKIKLALDPQCIFNPGKVIDV